LGCGLSVFGCGTVSAVLVAGLFPLFWWQDCICCFGCRTVSAVLVAGWYSLFWLWDCIRYFGYGIVSALLVAGLYSLFWLWDCIRYFGYGTVSSVLVAGLYPLFWLQDYIRFFGCGTVSAFLVARLYPLFWSRDCIHCFCCGTVSTILVAGLYPLFWLRDCILGYGTVFAVLVAGLSRYFGCGAVSSVLVAGLYPLFLVAGLHPLVWLQDCPAVSVGGLYPLFWLRNCIRCFGGGTVSAVLVAGLCPLCSPALPSALIPLDPRSPLVSSAPLPTALLSLIILLFSLIPPARPVFADSAGQLSGAFAGRGPTVPTCPLLGVAHLPTITVGELRGLRIVIFIELAWSSRARVADLTPEAVWATVGMAAAAGPPCSIFNCSWVPLLFGHVPLARPSSQGICFV
jgi:hypothetical protein